MYWCPLPAFAWLSSPCLLLSPPPPPPLPVLFDELLTPPPNCPPPTPPPFWWDSCCVVELSISSIVVVLSSSLVILMTCPPLLLPVPPRQSKKLFSLFYTFFFGKGEWRRRNGDYHGAVRIRAVRHTEKRQIHKFDQTHTIFTPIVCTLMDTKHSRTRRTHEKSDRGQRSAWIRLKIVQNVPHKSVKHFLQIETNTRRLRPNTSQKKIPDTLAPLSAGNEGYFSTVLSIAIWGGDCCGP